MTITKAGQLVLPWFKVADSDTSSGWRSLQNMEKILDRAGFKIQSVFDLDGQFLESSLANPAPNTVRFEVSLPDKWTLVEGYDGYGRKDSDIHDLLDEEDRLRGSIYGNELDGDGYHADLYTRYFKINLGGFCKLPIERPAGCITDIIVDRAAVDYRKPAEFPVVALHHSRMANPGPFVPPPVEEFEKWSKEERERIKEGRPKLDPPIYLMLHDQYPNWEDVHAYW